VLGSRFLQPVARHDARTRLELVPLLDLRAVAEDRVFDHRSVANARERSQDAPRDARARADARLLPDHARFDHRVGDPPSAPTGTADPVAAAAATAADAAAMILQQLGAALAGRFVGLGGPPSITTAPQVDIQTLSSRVAQLAEAVLLGSIAASDHVSLGSRQTPQASVVAGDVDIGDQTSGSGILVILGGLHVSGTFNFTGLVVVMGGISFEPGSEVSVAGALWRGPGVDRRMRLRGAGALMYSSEALAEADAAFPGVLPHAVVMSGWLEQL